MRKDALRDGGCPGRGIVGVPFYEGVVTGLRLPVEFRPRGPEEVRTRRTRRLLTPTPYLDPGRLGVGREDPRTEVRRVVCEWGLVSRHLSGGSRGSPHRTRQVPEDPIEALLSQATLSPLYGPGSECVCVRACTCA